MPTVNKSLLINQTIVFLIIFLYKINDNKFSHKIEYSTSTL